MQVQPSPPLHERRDGREPTRGGAREPDQAEQAREGAHGTQVSTLNTSTTLWMASLVASLVTQSSMEFKEYTREKELNKANFYYFLFYGTLVCTLSTSGTLHTCRHYPEHALFQPSVQKPSIDQAY